MDFTASDLLITSSCSIGAGTSLASIKAYGDIINKKTIAIAIVVMNYPDASLSG
jgi:hypothetical protein